MTVGAGHPEQFRELVALFLEGLEPGIASMRAALADGKAEELAIQAHGFKGTAASMGAMNLASLCVALEKAAARENLEIARALLGQIENEVDVVRGLLEREMRC